MSRMLMQYNKNLRFHFNQVGQELWLKNGRDQEGENKLAPKRTGPWTVIKKMPNGVNFEIQSDNLHKKYILIDWKPLKKKRPPWMDRLNIRNLSQYKKIVDLIAVTVHCFLPYPTFAMTTVLVDLIAMVRPPKKKGEEISR